MAKEEKKEEVNKVLEQKSGVMRIYKRGHSGLFDSDIFSPVLKVKENQEMVFSEIVNNLREQRLKNSEKADYRLGKKGQASKQVAYEIESIEEQAMGNIFSRLKDLPRPKEEPLE